MTEPTARLSDEQIAFFTTNGFLALDAVTTPEEIHTMRRAYDRIFAARSGREEGNQFDLAGADEEGEEAVLPQIKGPEKYAPELADALYRRNATEIARQLLGVAELRVGGHAIMKPPGVGAATALH